MYGQNLSEEEEAKRRRLAAMRMGIDQENDAQETMQEAAGEAAQGQPVSEEWTELEKLDQAVNSGAFKQESGDEAPTPPPGPQPGPPPGPQPTPVPQEQEDGGLIEATGMGDAAQEETQEIQQETPQEEEQQPDILKPEMAQAMTLIKSGRINEVSDETMKALDALAASSPGMAAALGLLTSENWNQFAYRTAGGEWKEKNDRVADYIYQDNYGILGATLSQYAMKLNDPDFPPELYDDAVGALLTIIQKAEAAMGDEYKDADLAQLLPNFYEEYYQNNKDSADFAALDDAFDYEDELAQMKAERDQLQAKLEQKAYEEAAARCRQGRGTAEDYKLINTFAPDLTREQMYEDESYINLMQEIKTGRSGADRAQDPENPNALKDWYDTNALKYMNEKGMGSDLNSVAGMRVKDMLMDFKLSALDQLKETAAKLGYKTVGEYMEKAGITMETIDEIANYDLRRFETEIANAKTLEEAKKLAYQGDGSVSGVEIVLKGIGTGVSEYFAEGFEALYTTLETMNISTDAARARALYTGQYGRFSGERELHNQLMSMCDEGYFPNEEMNGFVKRYLEAGGSPFELGIVPGDFGFIVEAENWVGGYAEEWREWSREELTPGQATAFNATAEVTKIGVGIAVEETLGKAIPNIPGYQKMINQGSDKLMALGRAARKNLPSYMADDVRSVLKAMDRLWRDDGLAMAAAFTVSGGVQAYNDGVSAGFADDRSIGESGTMGLANYTTALLNQYFSPGKAALELAVNGMPENQTMSFVAAVANASGEGANKTVNAAAEAAEGIGSVIGGAAKYVGDTMGKIGETVKNAGEAAGEIGADAAKRIAQSAEKVFGEDNVMKVKNAAGAMMENVSTSAKNMAGSMKEKVLKGAADIGEKAVEEVEGNIVSDLTNAGMKGVLGEPDGLPKNKEPIQAQTEALKEALDKEEVDFDDLSLLDQFREVGRRLLHLGL